MEGIQVNWFPSHQYMVPLATSRSRWSRKNSRSHVNFTSFLSPLLFNPKFISAPGILLLKHISTDNALALPALPPGLRPAHTPASLQLPGAESPLLVLCLQPHQTQVSSDSQTLLLKSFNGSLLPLEPSPNPKEASASPWWEGTSRRCPPRSTLQEHHVCSSKVLSCPHP